MQEILNLLWFFCTDYVLLTLEKLVTPDGDSGKFKLIKTVPMWGIIKCVLLNQILYFMVVILSYCLYVLFFPSSLFKGSSAEEASDWNLKGRDPAVWHVGLKVAWDIETPGLAIPLHQGDLYLMLGNFQGLGSWIFCWKRRSW